MSDGLVDKRLRALAALSAATRPARSGPKRSQQAPLEDRIRAAYLRVTGGVYNEQIKIVRLRAGLQGEDRDAVDAALLRMQQQRNAILYQIDDPYRLRPEDEAAALRVAGTRKDLVAIHDIGIAPGQAANFRDGVLRAARTTQTGRYGNHLVLISHVWRELQRQEPTPDLARFKADLLAAYVRGDLTLAKADMPQTLDPHDLDESRVRDHDRDLVFVELA
jgi:hypothetical protein